MQHKKSVRKSDFCFETKSHSVECFIVIIICCLGVTKIKDSVVTLDLFQNVYVPEEISVTLYIQR